MHALMSLHSCPSMARVLALDALAYRLGRDELCGLASNSCSLQSRTAQCAPPHCHGGDHGHVQTVRACYISVACMGGRLPLPRAPLRSQCGSEGGLPGEAVGGGRLGRLAFVSSESGSGGRGVNVGNV